MKTALSQQIAQGICAAYLGADAAARVLRGDVRLGSAHELDAVILFADLRGFTQLADTLARDELMSLLNGYLACIVTPVEARAGQVLKFMGDGLLAIFDPASGSIAECCDAALAAAADALAQVDDFSRQRRADNKAHTSLDIALHRGEVLYGNVGTAARLDFTVIGPAVNEAARMESLCERLQTHLLLSQAFCDAAGNRSAADIVALGQHSLRGVAGSHALYTVC